MNEENLKKGEATRFRSGEEAVRNGRKGGKNSGVSRSFKSALKKKIWDNPELTEELIDMLLHAALEGGNMQAVKMLLELNDEGCTDLDKKIKCAQLDKIKAETEEIRRKNNEGSGIDVEDELSKSLKELAEGLESDD